MHFSTILALTSSLALTASAAPTRRQTVPSYTLTFKGAADAAYTISIPADNTLHTTNNVLSISSVFSSDVDVAKYCTLQTVDYPPALVAISNSEWNVGPPQTVRAVSCRSDGNSGGSGQGTVHVEFQGADPSEGARYGVDVVTDGRVVATNNKLSISTIKTSYAGLDACTFVFADGSAALSKIATDTWAVGPPQWIDSISCKA